MKIEPILARTHGMGFHQGGRHADTILFILLVVGLIGLLAFSWSSGRQKKNDEK
jgi:hypothetical protein